MLKSLLLLIGQAILWILSLWFVLPIDLSTLSYPGLILLHVLPPFALLAIGLLLRSWRRRRKVRALARQQADDEATRQEVMATARQQREDEAAQRRFGCDCRAAVVTGLGKNASTLKAGLPEVTPDDDEADTLVDDEFDVEQPSLSSQLQEFAGPLRQALESIYTETPAALILPVYVIPPTHIPAVETIALIRQYIHEIGARLDSPIAIAPEDVRVIFAPSGNGPSDSAITIFDTLPDLPGAVLLALDSPVQRDQDAYAKLETSDQRAAMTAEMDEKATWCGMPGRAVVALLLTHPEIMAMLATIQDYSQDNDATFNAMTPFWQKTAVPDGQLAALARVAPTEREVLGRRPVLARIHRSAFGTSKSKARILEMNLYCQALLQKAFLAGGLLPGNCGSDEAPETPQDTKAPTPTTLGWLVHNAGTVERYGPRLGGLATAIRHFGFDLHPLSEATNFASTIGDFGLATPWAMLAEAVVHTSDAGAAVLCADFQMNDGLALSMTVPAPVSGL